MRAHGPAAVRRARWRSWRCCWPCSSLYDVEEAAFLRIRRAGRVGGFAVHYWLPFALEGAVLDRDRRSPARSSCCGPATAGLLIVGRARALRHRRAARCRSACAAALIAGARCGVLVYARATLGLRHPVSVLAGLRRDLHVPAGRSTSTTCASRRRSRRLQEFCAYFFLLPNYYFLLFPVIDFQTLRRTYYRRDIHDVAQQGIVLDRARHHAAAALSAGLPLEAGRSTPGRGHDASARWSPAWC